MVKFQGKISTQSNFKRKNRENELLKYKTLNILAIDIV